MSQQLLPYAAAILKLLNNVLYYDDKEWETLLTYQMPLQEHFASIGLALRVDEAEGYAYLVQPDPEGPLGPEDPEADGSFLAALREDPLPKLPRLVRRTRLTYEATLLCVILREELQNFDAREPDLDRLILSKAQMQELLQHFFPERADMTRVTAKSDSVINQVVRAGFLGNVKSEDEELYEVKRIIKARISADKLAEIREQLIEHAGAVGIKALN